jgi:poly(A) polymerase
MFEEIKFDETDGQYFPVWNPLNNFKDSLSIMPIITPAYPAMNSAYNVAQPQFRCFVVSFGFSFCFVYYIEN